MKNLLFLLVLCTTFWIGNLCSNSVEPLPEGACGSSEVENPCSLRGIWFPEASPLFLPFKADPRQLQASIGVRFHDDLFDSQVADVSYFNTVPIYRWFHLLLPNDQFQIDIDGATWAIFQPFEFSSPLVNADYFLGVTLSYALHNLSFRMRFYHISSHIGDEFLLLYPEFDRKNPSAEYIDLYASWQLLPDLRVYGGGGIIPHSDITFPCKWFFLQGGLELYLPFFRTYSPCHQLEGRPYFAMHFGLWEDNSFDVDQTYAIGYEFAKKCGLERAFRIFAEYHDGYSWDGQFCRSKTDYFSIRVSYGY